MNEPKNTKLDPPHGVAVQRFVRAPASEWRSATLTREIRGEFSIWKKGEVVWASHYTRGRFTIERMKRKPSGILKEGLPCLNVMSGVPRSALDLHDVWRSNVESSATPPQNPPLELNRDGGVGCGDLLGDVYPSIVMFKDGIEIRGADKLGNTWIPKDMLQNILPVLTPKYNE